MEYLNFLWILVLHIVCHYGEEFGSKHLKLHIK